MYQSLNKKYISHGATENDTEEYKTFIALLKPFAFIIINHKNHNKSAFYCIGAPLLLTPWFRAKLYFLDYLSTSKPLIINEI